MALKQPKTTLPNEYGILRVKGQGDVQALWRFEKGAY